MPTGSTPDMLVVLDDHPSSRAGLAIAQQYARGIVALAGWEAETGDLDVEVQASAASEPTVGEALRAAAQRGIGFVAMRRDLAEPTALLGSLLTAAAQNAGGDVPGFAVFLADGEPRPIRRILAIADRRCGPISGLLTHVAVTIAEASGAAVDTLVLDRGDVEITPDEQGRFWEINREQELFDAAMQRAADHGVRLTRIPVTTDDPWLVITNQLDTCGYDLVIDDLGDVSLGRRGAAAIDAVVSPGNVGEIPLRLLTQVPVPLLLVIDEIRLGIAPAALLKAGTVAALTLGMVSTAVLAPPGGALTAQAVGTAGEASRDIAEALEEALGGEEAPSGERAADAATSSRSGDGSGARAAAAEQQPSTPAASTAQAQAEEEKKAAEQKKGSEEPKPPKAPKGGANPADVAKAQKQAEKEKDAFAKEKARKEKAAKAAAKAEEELVAAQEQAESALAELQAAALSHEAAVAHAVKVQSDATGLTGILPGGATEQDTALAAEMVASAETRLASAVATGEAALDELTTAEEQLVEAEAALDAKKAEAKEAKAEYELAKEKVSVYKESLAETVQSPVRKGSYRLTARFGQSGGYWSSGIHTGLDFAGSSGTDILASASGKVVETGYAGPYGNRVVIDHGDGYQTTYNHLSSIRVSVGDVVQTGDHVGDMGATGNSTGVHLHFEVTKGGKFIDPETWLGW
jgi:murein DD-endopeptidase MepM/ murein hydrolase activator NlpD